MVDGLGWRWIFFVNIPFGIIAVAMAVIFLPRDKDKSQTQSQSVDWFGIGFLVIAIGYFWVKAVQESKRRLVTKGKVNSDRIPILNSLTTKLRNNTASKFFSAKNHSRKLIRTDLSG